MAKRKISTELSEGYIDETLNSGVTIRIKPFSARLWDRIQQRGLNDFPDPVPPKKTIKTFDGEEVVDDFNNEDYLAEIDQIKSERDNFTGTLIAEAMMDLFIEVDLSKYTSEIKRLEKYVGEPVPKDETEKKIYFLENFAFTGRADYEKASTATMMLMTVGDSEVAKRIESFRSDVERAKGSRNGASGSNEIERVEVEQKKE